ncbi:putative GTP-binding protein EngB [uncultured Desulfatiglans sp.]|uniref:Probable GTP-binding protein EngB n=1 Tax=Uncultured Desulfatiglans sp. TaxID=1748965 RepID=A0A653AB68_UNCDX|nr:putative GTP-binding protein EngB [uncultured Desulfatiglans sp.]
MDAAFVKAAYRKDQFPPPDRPEVAFAGRSNVGKSSLINVLVNRRGLARTSASPGRTQAINFFRLDDAFYLVDLPGYGFAKVPLSVKESWRRMVEEYLLNRSNLAAVVVILDIRRDPAPGDKELLEWLEAYGIPALPVLTKADKLSRNQAQGRLRDIATSLSGLLPMPPILFSAKTRQGRDEIWKAIHSLAAGPRDYSSLNRPSSNP